MVPSTHQVSGCLEVETPSFGAKLSASTLSISASRCNHKFFVRGVILPSSTSSGLDYVSTVKIFVNPKFNESFRKQLRRLFDMIHVDCTWQSVNSHPNNQGGRLGFVTPVQHNHLRRSSTPWFLILKPYFEPLPQSFHQLKPWSCLSPRMTWSMNFEPPSPLKLSHQARCLQS